MERTERFGVHRNPEYRNSWLNSRKHILLILSIGGVAVILLWQLIDIYLEDSFDSRRNWLRWITIAVLSANLLIGLMRKKPEAVKQHLVAGFYIATLYCTFLTMLTGASQSPYWFNLFFVIVAWFVFVPFSLRELLAHSIVFVLLFIGGQFLQQQVAVFGHDMIRIILLYLGALIVSFFATYIRNQLDLVNFKIKKELQLKNQELSSLNIELKEEIEKHKITTQKLTENRQFLNNILTNAPLVIWSIDLNGIFTYSQYKGDRGIIPGQRVGQSALDLYAGTEVETFLRKVLKDEIKSDILNVNSVYYDTRVSSIYNENGEKTGYLGVSMDITERINNERELRKFREVLEQAPSAVFIMDKHSNFEYLNPSFTQLSGYTKNDLLNKNIKDTLYRGISEIPKSRNEISTALTAGKVWKEDLLTIHKNGTKYWANTIAAPFKNENGETDGFIVIQQDITERLKTEEELRIAKEKLETLNQNLEFRIQESSLKLTEANTQLIQLQKENLQSQFEVLRQQVNPHFLFNSLNVLTSLIKLEPDLAEKFTEHLSKVYRYVLENKDNDLVNLQTELDFLDAYIFLLNIRFMDKINIVVTIPDHQRNLLILPLALQLLIENAIKHNSMSKKNPLKIEIFIDDNKLLNVVNNLQERESHMASTGVGLKNIEHRYHLLEMPLPVFFKTDTQFIAQIPLRNENE